MMLAKASLSRSPRAALQQGLRSLGTNAAAATALETGPHMKDGLLQVSPNKTSEQCLRTVATKAPHCINK